jgi:hypothetical protein
LLQIKEIKYQIKVACPNSLAGPIFVGVRSGALNPGQLPTTFAK